MKKRNIPFILILIMLFSLSALFAILANQPEKAVKRYTVSVLMPKSNDAKWDSLKTGMQSAAEESRIILRFVDTNSDLSEENINEAVQNGDDGIIADVSDEDNEILQSKASSSLPIQYIESRPANVSDSTNCLAIHNENAGYSIGELILQNHSSKELSIGIINVNDDYSFTQERLKGIINKLKEENIFPSWVLTGRDLSGTEIAAAQNADPVQVLLCLDNDSTEVSIDAAVLSTMVPAEIYGFGSSSKCIYHTDLGTVNNLVVSDEYLIGYDAVMNLYRKFTRSISTDEHSISYRIISKQNLFTRENQQRLFPVE